MEWENFAFEYQLQHTDLIRHLVHIEAFKEAALNLVLPPDWSAKLDRLNRVRAVHGTTALEGNPLSEAEVNHQLELIEKPPIEPESKLTKEQLQIRNSGRAQEWVRIRFDPEHGPLTLEDILTIHKMVTYESDESHNAPGKLRTFPVVVGSADMGGVHRCAPAERLSELMEKYVEFINSKKLTDGAHPVIHALLAHFFLVTIHPFGDGNGRVSRLVEAGILFRHGYNVHGFYGLSNYFYRNEIKYKTLLQQCRKGDGRVFDVTPLIAFGMEGFAAELKGINSFIKTKLNRVVYRNMLVRALNTYVGDRRRLINDREYRLLEYLIDETEPVDPFSEDPSRRITFVELIRSKYVLAAYRGFTPRTFARELDRLGELGFITISRHEKDSTLELNLEAIGKY